MALISRPRSCARFSMRQRSEAETSCSLFLSAALGLTRSSTASRISERELCQVFVYRPSRGESALLEIKSAYSEATQIQAGEL